MPQARSNKDATGEGGPDKALSYELLRKREDRREGKETEPSESTETRLPQND